MEIIWQLLIIIIDVDSMFIMRIVNIYLWDEAINDIISSPKIKEYFFLSKFRQDSANLFLQNTIEKYNLNRKYTFKKIFIF